MNNNQNNRGRPKINAKDLQNERKRQLAYRAAYEMNKPSGQAANSPNAEQQRVALSRAQANTFMSRRNSFINSNDLQLHQSYHSERDKPNHPYPEFDWNKGKASVGQHVDYFDRDSNKRQNFAVSFNNSNLQQAGIRNPHSNQQEAPTDIHEKVIFTRRGSNAGSLLAMPKMEQTDNNKRVQHSSFNAGLPVANAGELNFNKKTGSLESVRMASGHYDPHDNPASAVKMAMWAEDHNAFDTNKVKILKRNRSPADVSMQSRVKAVNNWAQSHPKRK